LVNGLDHPRICRIGLFHQHQLLQFHVGVDAIGQFKLCQLSKLRSGKAEPLIGTEPVDAQLRGLCGDEIKRREGAGSKGA